MLQKFGRFGIFVVFGALVVDGVLWHEIIFSKTLPHAELFFLDVGQGDATLLRLPGGVDILTDAGPDGRVIRRLEEVLGTKRYIDLAMVTHPELDHLNGFNYLLDRYEFGAFIVNGRMDATATQEWQTLVETIKEKRIPLVTLGRGDRIRNRESDMAFLSPDAGWRESGALNDTGLVAFVRTPEFSALFTADIGENVEKDLIDTFKLGADILKVGHHGSKYSSSDIFLKEVSPKIAVASAGAENRHGHPAEEAIARIRVSGAELFRTDVHGTVHIVGDGSRISVFLKKRQ